MPSLTVAERVSAWRDRAEVALERWLPPAATHPARLHAAIRYAVLGGGKRVRPLLAYASGEWLGLPAARVDAIAVAIELVHAYSLVHDDLPAMDDDDLRRGRATTHIAFDEATALLVGDALQAHAYHVLATDATLVASASVRRELVLDLARASGSGGMAGGQALDMAAPAAATATPAEVEALYGMKTGRLLEAAVLMPVRLAADGDARVATIAARYGRAVGLAFQVADDLIELEVPAEVTGKTAGSDERNGKRTLASLVGAGEARRRLEVLQAEALDALAGVGESAEALRWLCRELSRRDR
jgi:farnesyl diphosphate synthase